MFELQEATVLESEPLKKSNCIGYTFYSLGLIPEEQEIEEPSYLALRKYLRLTDKKNAQAIGVVSSSGKREDGKRIYKGEVVHLAIIDKNNPDFVLHRPGSGDDVVSENSESAFQTWQNSEDYKIMYFKVKGKHPPVILQPSTIHQAPNLNLYRLT